ncbi:MAG: hypothetical protein JNM99_00505 [Verrucomicrobiaceae bacterium]|nr:hypothetical protein [Verrucomicrobiaceae bacterium]
MAIDDPPHRHEIMKDSLFWTKLAYDVCGWLRGEEDASFRRFWIDDFLPESAANTQLGVDIEGTAWTGEGPREQKPYRFRVSVPQRILHSRRDRFAIERLDVDHEQQTLKVVIGEGKPIG